MMKKALLGVLAALGLGATVPTMVVSAVPDPATEGAPAAPSPFRNTDGRSTRYYVPKKRKSKRRLASEATRKFFGRIRSIPNRFFHRSIAKAALAGRGPLVHGGTAGHYVRANGRRTTRRAIEGLARERFFLRELSRLHPVTPTEAKS